jgi:hypothetical protein
LSAQAGMCAASGVLPNARMCAGAFVPAGVRDLLQHGLADGPVGPAPPSPLLQSVRHHQWRRCRGRHRCPSAGPRADAQTRTCPGAGTRAGTRQVTQT